MTASTRPSVLFVCRNFHRMAGGIERMATRMMNEMVARGFRVGLITWDPAAAEAHYPLDAAVEWMKLDLGDAAGRAGWGLRWKRQVRIRQFTRAFRPDVAIAFQVGTFLSLRTALIGMDVPIIAAERNAPDLFDHVTGGDRQRRRANLALATAACITVQLESYRDKYPAGLRDRIVAIPNPVDPVAMPPLPNEAEAPPRLIVNVGRLSYQKNQDFLLRAFARIAPANPDWTLALVGDGEKRDDLTRLTETLGLAPQVRFAGAVKDVSAWYAQAAFLAFPSLWEGFPNALVEAFAHGVPALGFSSTAGVNELIRDGGTGLLVPPREDAFAAAMQRLIDTPALRQEMGRNAVRSVAGYVPQSIFDQWEDLFLRLACRRPGARSA